MNTRKFITLQILYLKRLFAKKSFVLLILLIPLLTLGLRLMANDETGVARIILVDEGEDREDQNIEIEAVEDGSEVEFNDVESIGASTYNETGFCGSVVIDRLMESDSLISFEEFEDADVAMQELRQGNVDAVWIFPDDFTERIKDYASGDYDEIVEIYQLEDTTTLKLSREILFSNFYDAITYEEYALFVDEMIGSESLAEENGANGGAIGGTTNGDISEDELSRYYEYYLQEGSLFEYKLIDGSEWENPQGMLTAPIRGMLALVILLFGIAGAMYFRQDKENGVYDFLSREQEIFYKIPSVFIPLFVAGIASIFAIFLSGNGVGYEAIDIFREIILMLEYTVMCGVFCIFLDSMFNSLLVLGILSPFIILISFALCPVFFLLRGFEIVKLLLPTYYYLMGASDNTWMARGLIYIVLMCMLIIGKYAFDFLIQRLATLKRS